MNAGAYAKMQLEQAFNLLNMSADGLDDAQYNWAPDGTCNPIAKSHVHALTATDFFVLSAAKGGQMLWMDVAAAAGLPAKATEIWRYTGEIPQAAIKEYGQKVQKQAIDFAASLSDEDLDREVETQFFGKQSVAFLVHLAGVHTAGHAGEIAAVKGMQGMKGLPF